MPASPARTGLGRRVAANTSAQILGRVCVLAVGAVSIAVATRYLGPTQYGRYGLALSVMQLFGVFADAGVTTIVVRECARRPERTGELVGNALTLRLLISLVVIGGAALISLALPYEPEVRWGIVIAGGSLLFGGLTSSITAVLQTELRMARAAIGDVIGRAAAFGGLLVVVLANLGFYWALAAAGFGAAVTLAVTWALTRRLAPLSLRASPALWRWLLGASLPVGLALALNEMYVRADTIVISGYRDFDEVGLYALAYRVLEVVSLMGTAFLTSVFPLIAGQVDTDRARFERMLQSAWDAFVIVGAPLAACGAVVAPQIARLAGGAEFSAAADPLRLLLISGALAFVNGVLGFGLIAIDRQRKTLWLNVTGLIVNVAANLVVVPRFGITGAAVVTVATELLLLAGSLWLARRHMRFTPSFAILVPALGAAGITAALVALVPVDTLVVLVPLGVAVYAGLIYATSARARALVVQALAR